MSQEEKMDMFIAIVVLAFAFFVGVTVGVVFA